MMPLNQFWHTTGRTFLCHLNIKYKQQVPDTITSHQAAALEYLKNLTPDSVVFNETVLKLRRHRRHTAAAAVAAAVVVDDHRNLVNNTTTTSPPPPQKNSNQLSNLSHEHLKQIPSNINLLATKVVNKPTHSNNNLTVRRHTERSKYKTYVRNRHALNSVNTAPSTDGRGGVQNNPTPTKVSALILNEMDDDDSHDVCAPLAQYSLLLAGVYVLFAMSTFHFVFMTESAVFTVAVLSAALPVCGIFWSLFELTTHNGVGK